jgi:hypothetical protein
MGEGHNRNYFKIMSLFFLKRFTLNLNKNIF